MLNPHDDGIGLDDFVDWMADSGWPIERIGDHDQWYARFETAIRDFPDRQRQASLLPLLHTTGTRCRGAGEWSRRWSASVRR